MEFKIPKYTTIPHNVTQEVKKFAWLPTKTSNDTIVLFEHCMVKRIRRKENFNHSATAMLYAIFSGISCVSSIIFFIYFCAGITKTSDGANIAIMVSIFISLSIILSYIPFRRGVWGYWENEEIYSLKNYITKKLDY